MFMFVRIRVAIAILIVGFIVTAVLTVAPLGRKKPINLFGDSVEEKE
jgi:hypothetical protein